MEDTRLKDVVKIEYVTDENSVFTEHDGYIGFTFRPENGEEKTYPRVGLGRNFPDRSPEEFVSVLDPDGAEIAMIRSVGELGGEAARIVREELKRRYFVFTVRKITSVNQRFGYSYWKVRTDEGDREFTVRDTFSNFRKTGSDRAYVTDVDGNRYVIPSFSSLDRSSMKKIELFI